MLSESVEQVFLPLPTARHLVPPTTRIRSTLVMSSLKTLREENLFALYQSNLEPLHRDTILELATPCWLPIEVGLAHYAACNELGLPPSRVLEIAQRVSTRAHGTFLGVALGLARGIGVTPWTALAQMRPVWERAFDGGAVSATKLGDNDARIEIVAWPCARIEYCRLAFRGLVEGVGTLLSKNCRSRELPAQGDARSTVSYRLSWT